MKSFACVLLLAAFVVAEPPLYRNARFTFQRQESEREPTTARNEEAPYAPAGFKPSKEFKLPSRQEVAPPATSYGVPSDSYAVPAHLLRTSSGVRSSRNSGREEPEKKEKEGKGEEQGEVENLKVEGAESEGKERKEKKGKLEEAPKGEAEVVNARGAYYVLLPTCSCSESSSRLRTISATWLTPPACSTEMKIVPQFTSIRLSLNIKRGIRSTVLNNTIFRTYHVFFCKL